MAEENALQQELPDEPVLESVEQDDTVPEQAEAEATEAPKEEKQKNNIQKRIDDISKQKYEALNEAERVRKENEELKAKLSEFNTNKPAPTLESFDYDEGEYQKAVIATEAEKAALRIIEKREKRQQALAQEQKAIEAEKKFADREAIFSQSVPDYDQIARRQDIPITAPLAEIIRNSEQGPAIAYYLGSHLDELYELKDLPELQQQRELLSIEAKISQKPQISNTPEPVPDVGGMDTPVVDMDKLSPEEWRIARNRQVHGK